MARNEKKMEKIKIRRINETDLEAISNLYQYFWNENSNIIKMKEKYNELKKNTKYIFLCAEIDNKVIGTIMGIICDELYGECNPFLIIEDLIVNKEYRNMGIGKRLMNELENIAKQSKCSQIQFITEANRSDTISFYESLGFNSKTHIGFKKNIK